MYFPRSFLKRSKASHYNEENIHQPDGKSDCNLDESQSAKILCPDNSKSEDFMEKELNVGKSQNLCAYHKKNP